MKTLPKGELLAPTMWNSPKTQIPIGVWKGGEQGLNKSLPNYKTSFDSFQLFWPTHLLKRFLIKTNKYAILELEGGGKGEGTFELEQAYYAWTWSFHWACHVHGHKKDTTHQ